jgi:hypothetical protein
MAKKATLLEVIDKNLPAIYTAASIIIGGITAVAAVRAGWKTKEILDDLPEDTDTLVKVKAVAPTVAPIVVGAVADGLFCYAAHHESTKRYVALAGTVAALKADKEHLEIVKDKAKELLGEKKSEELSNRVADEEATRTARKVQGKSSLPGTIDIHQKVRIRDLENGYIFETTLRDFEKAKDWFNLQVSEREMAMNDFYDHLLGENYEEYGTHGWMGFGPDCSEKVFLPELDADMADDLSLGYTISYPYSNLEAYQHKGSVGDPWRAY